MAELIQKQDTLNEGRVKINAAITDAEQAKVTADGADSKATQALANSESTQTQLDTIVINGDSSVEAAQARVDENGVGHTTLKDRIDDGFTKVTSQLNDIAIDSRRPPAGLNPLIMDGVTDETDNLQILLDYIGNSGGGTLLLSAGVLVHTINFIPNNVTILGKGPNRTVIKLKDDCIKDNVRKQTGLYPAHGVDFFSVKEITYDGNASENINIANATDHDLYYSHGISNSYTDTSQDPYIYAVNGDELKTAKDFLIENVVIRNTVRNSILIGGKSNQRGFVKNVIMVNSYLDHFIYESSTNSKIVYENIKTVGFWRGAAIVASNGYFKNISHEHPSKNPNELLNLVSYFTIRNYELHDAVTSPIFEKVNLSLLLETFHAILVEATPRCRYTMRDVVIKQKDNIAENIYGAPFTFLLGSAGKNVTVSDVEFFDIESMNLLYLESGSENYKISRVQFNYSIGRGSTSDSLIVIRNTGEDAISNVSINNIYSREKSPSILRLIKSSSMIDVTPLINITFDNINLKTDDNTTDVFDVLSSDNYYVGEKIIINNSDWDGYAPLGNSYAQLLRDKYGMNITNSFHNRIPSDNYIMIPFPPGTKELTRDYPYIMTAPRTVIVRCRYNSDNIPSIKFSNLKITVTFKSPVSEYEEVYISSTF